MTNHLPERLYDWFIRPRHSDADSLRHEFILNTLLSGLLLVGAGAIVLIGFDWLFGAAHDGLVDILFTAGFWVVIGLLLGLSRWGHPMWAAFILEIFLLLSSLLFVLTWGIRLAEAELVFALSIVVAGVLLRARLALVVSVVAVVLLLGVAYFQVNDLQHPRNGWETEQVIFQDAIGYAAIFLLMGVASWLSNLEADRALRRARHSEQALQRERDSLEAKVIERTRELEELQLARLLELQPFAEFGRIGASLVHEIANPLTAATLNLEELSRQQHSELVRQLKRNLHHLERYLTAARKQIKRQSDLRTFSVGVELRQVAHLLRNRANKAGVRLQVDKIPNVKLYGDTVKFSQLVANILVNAIDAAEQVADPARREVTVAVTDRRQTLEITIADRGTGIAAHDLEHLFEPFYSTKSSPRGGLGIGLAMVKQYVEDDFGGSIKVVSSSQNGTTFTLRLRGGVRP